MAHGDHHDTIVIGAGQAGLATSEALQRRGIEHLVLEGAARVGDQWRQRWASLRLYSPAKSDALPGLPFPAAADPFPTGTQMGDYLASYVDARRLPVRTGVRVTRLTRAAPGGFHLDTGAGPMTADHVVVATGAFRTPRTPAFANELDPAVTQLHSAQYRGPEQLAPGAVLVVGVSHSGADIAHEAARSGHRTILSGMPHGQLPFSIESRRGRIAWRVMSFVFSHVLTMRTPMGRRAAPHIRHGGGPLLRIRMPDLLAAGVEHRPMRTVGVRDGHPLLADGSTVDVTTVVWCTGFRPDYAWVEPLSVDPDGWPIQRRGVTDVPGLYVTGVPFQYAFSSMLVLGAARDAAFIADHLAAQRRRVPSRLTAVTA